MRSFSIPSKKSFKAVPPAGFGTKPPNSSANEGDYFDESDEETSVHRSKPLKTQTEEEDDPLDAFMASIDEQVKVESKVSSIPLPEIVSYSDDEFEVDNYPPTSSTSIQSAGTLHDGEEPVADKKKIEPLPPVDHSLFHYPPFERCFYRESPELSSLDLAAVSSARNRLELSVSAPSIMDFKPLQTFSQAGFDKKLLEEISRAGFQHPTPIQAQALPVALSGVDLLGLAKTGSGKTLAYVWPMLVHILHQPQMKLGEGPVGLILCPTRELVNQIYSEVRRFGKVFNVRVSAVVGGAGKWEMAQALKEAPEVVVATPGRLIEMIKTKATNLQRCTMCVLDEADRMFELGFEYQMRSIVSNIRPDRQLLMFSATMKKRVEVFAREMLRNEVRVVVGNIGQANTDIRQIVEILPGATEKWSWLSTRVDEFTSEGKVLVFVLAKADCEALAGQLRTFFAARQLDVRVECLHGDKDQADRARVMKDFSIKELGGKEIRVLVATDVAARGLDISDIRNVINYDIAKNIETYVHRIGRTGRMGVEGVVPGTAYTLLTPGDSSFSVDLLQNLRRSQQPVPPALQTLAERDPKWARIGHKLGHSGPGRGPGKRVGGAGIGFHSSKPITSAGLSQGGGNISLPPALQRKFVSASQVQKPVDSASNFTPQDTVGEVQANPYIEGRSLGRGQHLTQPSWMRQGGPSLPPPDSTDNTLVPTKSVAPQQPVRKSRFSSSGTTTSAVAPAPSSRVLSGFVRASTQDNTSLSTAGRDNTRDKRTFISETQDEGVSKRRRWDH